MYGVWNRDFNRAATGTVVAGVKVSIAEVAAGGEISVKRGKDPVRLEM